MPDHLPVSLLFNRPIRIIVAWVRSPPAPVHLAEQPALHILNILYPVSKLQYLHIRHACNGNRRRADIQTHIPRPDNASPLFYGRRAFENQLHVEPVSIPNEFAHDPAIAYLSLQCLACLISCPRSAWTCIGGTSWS